MRALIKNSVFYLSKYLGLFALSRRIYRNKVRVLCYHGFTLIDEHLNVPGLFIEPQVFAQRLEYLQRMGYLVMGLHDAYLALKRHEQAADRVVITIDDGYFSVLKKAAPILKQYSYPATLYLTSYYFDKNCPVFTLATGYMFWKSQVKTADFSALEIPELSSYSGYEMTAENKHKVSLIVKEYGQSLDGNEKRVNLLKKLGVALGVDYDQLNQDRILNLITRKELEELQKHGIDIQLHTHRHTFPVETELARKEIQDNKKAVNPYLETPMQHFCFPSGVWSTRHWQALQEEQVLTATTCETGLVDENSPSLAWRRILDSSRVSQIEFEAEISGFNELIRKVRS